MNMRKIHLIFAAAAVLTASCAGGTDVSGIADAGKDQITRVEPPCWWAGMKTGLQLLIQGPDISEYEVSIEGLKGVKATKVHKADSPNYLFVDVTVAPGTEAGDCYLVFRREGESFKYRYNIAQRREGSAERQSFTTADLIYLIMPDRFVDADQSLDCVPRNMESVDKEAFFGRHGGDIAGIRSQLDYIADLGVTAIWNTPLLEDNEPTSSYHGYACSDYYNIDRRFGSNEDYRQLVADAHSKGIKMIMDIVPNHCGAAHWWMADLPFEDWIHVWPEYTHSNCSFSMQNSPYAAEIDKNNMESGWFDTSMPDMNLDNPYVEQYFKQWAVWWIEYADLDGLRVDTYPYNEKYPMARWCKSVREEYPHLNIVGEVWTNNVPQLAYWQAGNPNKDGFDSHLPCVMDFPLQTALSQGVAQDKVNWDEGLVKVYESIANDIYYTDVNNMMIFAGNHDTERIADMLGHSVPRQKLVFTLLATLRGIPQVFYADELMGVSRDMRQGHGGLRIDFPLDWQNNPESVEVHDHFRRLFTWRKTASAIHNGGTIQFLRRDNTLAYFRYNDEQTVFVYANNSHEEKVIPWEDYREFTMAGAARRGADSKELVSGTDIVGGNKVDFGQEIRIAPLSTMVVEFE